MTKIFNLLSDIAKGWYHETFVSKSKWFKIPANILMPLAVGIAVGIPLVQEDFTVAAVGLAVSAIAIGSLGRGWYRTGQRLKLENN